MTHTHTGTLQINHNVMYDAEKLGMEVFMSISPYTTRGTITLK